MTSKLNLIPKDIPERLKRLRERIVGVKGLSALWVFGSFARGDTTTLSDVDLAFLTDKPLDAGAAEDFERRLYHIVSSTLGTDEISLVDLRHAPTFLSWHVLAEGKLLFCRDSDAVASLAERIFIRAPDIRWLIERGNSQFLEALMCGKRAVDVGRVTSFLRLITEDLQTLREKRGLGLQEYLNSRDQQSIVERRLQTAIESALNIGNHVIARMRLRAPRDYADVFRILQEAGVLSEDAAQAMADMARFRNLLVHVYWELDHKRIYETLPQRIETLEKFVNGIAKWLRDPRGEGR